MPSRRAPPSTLPSSYTLHMSSSTRSLGLKILGVWLILYGLIDLLGLSFAYDGLIMAVLALVAGVILLIGG